MPQHQFRALACAATLVLLLGACGASQDAPVPAPAAPAPAGGATASQETVRPAPAAPAVAPAVSDVQLPSGDDPRQAARMDGFGALRLGMSLAEVEAAWPGLLSGVRDAAARRDCFHVGAGDLSHFAMMFDDGRFVRYGGASDEVSAPGGGRRGMPEAELKALYQQALQARPDRFAPGGKLLSLQASGVAPAKLVFVLRPDGVVNEWYVGLLPQADYDEGCESDR